MKKRKRKEARESRLGVKDRKRLLIYNALFPNNPYLGIQGDEDLIKVHPVFSNVPLMAYSGFSRLGGENTETRQGFTLPEIPAGAGEFAKALIDIVAPYLSDDWEKDGFGWTKESGGFFLFGSDGTAPFIKYVEPGLQKCCTPAVGGKGVEIEVTITVSDDKGWGNDAGVKRVLIEGFNLIGDNVGPYPFKRANAEWILSEDEDEATEDGEASHTFKVCAGCNMIKDDVVPLLITVEDDAGNCRKEIRTIPINSELTCCD